MDRILAIACSLICAASSSLGQSALPKASMDSLLRLAADPGQNDTARLKALDIVAWDGYLFTRADSALHYASLHLDLAKRLAVVRHEAIALNTMGVARTYLGYFDEALEAHKAALAIHERMENLKGMRTALENIGLVYNEKGDLNQALMYHLDALRITEGVDPQERLGTLNNVAAIYHELGDNQQALDFYLQCEAIGLETGNEFATAAVMTNMSSLLEALGDTVSATEYRKKSLAIYERLGYAKGIAAVLTNMAATAADGGDIEGGLALFTKAIQLHEDLNDPKALAIALMGLGRALYNHGDINGALHAGTKGMDLARAMELPLETMNGAKLLAMVHKGLGQPETALPYMEEFIALKEDLLNDERRRDLMRQQFRYEQEREESLRSLAQEKKDALTMAENRRRSRQRNTSYVALAMSLLAATIFLIQRNRISREKERSDKLLLNILPYETAQELKEKGSSEARLISKATVLFTDFQDFTGIAERLTPAELVAEVNTCFSAFDRIMEKHGVEKIKTIGDAYMAAGGLPTPNTTHATDVVAAALEIRDFMLQRKEFPGVKAPFEIRVGVHTGPVVAGIVGIKKFQYDIWGDTVNLAARLESSGEVGRVNTSTATHALVKDRYHCTPRGSIEAKGKGRVEMWFVEEPIT